MNKYKNYLAWVSILVCIFTLMCCQKKDSVVSNNHKDTVNDADENVCLTYYVDAIVYMDSCKDIILEDFLNTPELSVQYNEKIKTDIISIILYVYGFEIGENEILLAIDESKSMVFFEQYHHYKKGWTIIDEIHYLKENSRNSTLIGIDANFMMKQCNIIEENYLQISVPFNTKYMSTKDGGRTVYDFYFSKVDNEYKIVGITVDV